jgi:DNA-binding CsgD family transcriptional regulator
MKRDEALLFFSVLFFLLAGLLYAWGPPAWFSRFPYAAGLRFLLALEAYFLCCALFFSFRIASFPRKTKHAFVKAFSVSFAAIPILSLLVIFNSPIHILRTFVRGLDIAGWLFVMFLAIRTSAKDRLFISALFFISGVLLVVPPIPSIIVIVARFVFLSIFSVKSFQAAQDRGIQIPVLEPADFRDVAERFALSPRETEVLSLLVAGKTNNEIGEILFVSLSTVKTHIASIFEKTGARNRLEASALCKKA